MISVEILLNSGFTGANAFFAMAQQMGLFRHAGLDVRFTPGRGAYTAAARLRDEGFDLAYGDVNALTEMAALAPSKDLPKAVFMVHQHAPSCITVPASGPIHNPADLARRRLTGHASDVALRTFAAYAAGAGLRGNNAVDIETSEAPMAELLQDMLQGKTDAVFGYMTTHAAALAGAGIAIDRVRFLPYRDVCGVLYGSALMASPRFMHDHPGPLARLVGVVRRGILAAQAQPGQAIDAVLVQDSRASAAIEAQRWSGTLAGDIGWPLAAQHVLGEVDGRRLDASTACLSSAFGWLHTPASARIFTGEYLGAPSS